MNKFSFILRCVNWLFVKSSLILLTLSLNFVQLDSKIFAQANGNQIIKRINFSVPDEFSKIKNNYSVELNSLKGLSPTSARVNQVCDKISNDLRNKGFTFNRVITKFSTDGQLDIQLLVGKNGDAFVTGNNWLSQDSLLDSLSWKSGEYFNYSKFQLSASNLNSNRFVNVDTKLKPRRNRSGEVIVDADFDVEDSLPISLTANLANDGNAKSSGWRSTLGLEWIDPFPHSDKISFNWLTDPDNTSALNSFNAQYMGSYGDDWNWAMFTGYSESEYNNVLSPVSFDILGEGFFAGLMVSNKVAELNSGPISINFGLTYLDLENSFSFISNPNPDDKSELSFLVPKIGVQGVLNNPDIVPGRSFWSLSVLSDAGSADDAELKTQRPGASSGFFAGQLAFTTLQALSRSKQKIDLYLNMASQLSNDPLPSSLQKSIGGVHSVRGYDEREAFGDHGFHLNSELRFGAFSIGKAGRIEPFTFYDVGYVSSEESLSGVKDSTSMQSVGAGFRCAFKPTLGMDFHLGVPLKESADTKKSDARLHFNLDFRF